MRPKFPLPETAPFGCGLKVTIPIRKNNKALTIRRIIKVVNKDFLKLDLINLYPINKA
jgi:hypothetical protein